MTLQVQVFSTSGRNQDLHRKDEEQSLLTEQDGVPTKHRATCSLILSHRACGRKIAKSILKKWRAHLAEDDLNSLVDLALCEAAMRFNPELGNQFITFLFFHIRGHLIKTIAQAKKDHGFKLACGQKEICEETQKVSPQNEVNSFLIEQEEKLGNNNPENWLNLKQEMEIFHEAKEKLPELESTIIRRCLLGGEQVNQVAEELGLSRYYVSRTKTKALKKLRKLVVKASNEKHYTQNLKKLSKDLAKNAG